MIIGTANITKREPVEVHRKAEIFVLLLKRGVFFDFADACTLQASCIGGGVGGRLSSDDYVE